MTFEIIDNRKIEFPSGQLDLDAALAVWEQLQDALSGAEWPRLEVVAASADWPEDGEPRQLRCPRCGHCSTEVISADLSDERRTTLDSDEEHGDIVFGGYDSRSDYHNFLYRCTGCEKPVSLPHGWDEQ